MRAIVVLAVVEDKARILIGRQIEADILSSILAWRMAVSREGK